MRLPFTPTLSRLNETSLHIIQVPDVNAHCDGMDSGNCLTGAVPRCRDPLRTMERVFTSGMVAEPGAGYGMPKANLIAKVLDSVRSGGASRCHCCSVKVSTSQSLHPAEPAAVTLTHPPKFASKPRSLAQGNNVQEVKRIIRGTMIAVTAREAITPAKRR